MGEHVCRALAGERVVSPSAFVKNPVDIETFEGSAGGRARFRCLLDAMHEKCVEHGPNPEELPEGGDHLRVPGVRRQAPLAGDVQDVRPQSDAFDSFMDLSLDVAKAKSVEAALKRYVAVEVLDGSNQYKCEMGRVSRT